MITLVEVLKRTSEWLREREVDSPRLDAELLLSHVLGIERLQLYLNHERPMSDDELEALRPLVRRRGQREPLAYILGTRGFHALDLEVRPGTLVPRPDTEILVEAALEWIGDTPDDPTFIADVGAGTGAVGLALAHARPELRVYATDISPIAIECTKANIARLDLGRRVAVLTGPYLDPIPRERPIDWVVSNPPYIPTRDIEGLQEEVARFEPHLALDGGRDGLACYHALIPAAAQRARAGVLVEIGHDQADAVRELFREAGLTDIRVWKDFGQRDRVVGGRCP